MIQIGILCLAILSVINLVLTILALKRIADSRQDRDNQPLQDELRSLREAVSRSEQEIRNEIRKGHETTTKILMGNIGEFGKLLTTQAEGMRTTVDKRFQDLQGSMETRLEKIRETVTAQLTNGTKAINDLTQSNETRMDKVRTTVDERLQAMQKSNEGKLDEMRKTVDEKLQSTLEKRLGESFNQVRKQLEDVHRGLGEMQELATGVGDLKRVLTNVKTRGTWGKSSSAPSLRRFSRRNSTTRMYNSTRILVKW